MMQIGQTCGALLAKGYGVHLHDEGRLGKATCLVNHRQDAEQIPA
jgi:hypothetical protein